MKLIHSDLKLVWVILLFLITFFILKWYDATKNDTFDSAKIHPASLILHKQC